jgi:hypothetical protein
LFRKNWTCPFHPQITDFLSVYIVFALRNASLKEFTKPRSV